MDEEVVLLEEQLALAHADIERLQGLLTEAEAKAGARDSELTSVRSELDVAHEAIAARDATLASHIEALASAEDRSREATSRYRDAVLARESELPTDLVSGTTIAEIDESLARARQTVAQVRQHIEQQAQSLRVPAGAPARGSPDYSSLSAAEKIRLGLQQT